MGDIQVICDTLITIVGIISVAFVFVNAMKNMD